MGIGYVVHGRTDRGRSREVNEDSLGQRALPDGMIAVVADGVGGQPGGAFASRLAVARILDSDALTAAAAPAERLAAACAEANAALREAQQTHAGYEDMATTVVALLAQAEQAAILHAGDSRCYRWRGGVLTLLTRDHTVAEQMVEDGPIPAAAAGRTPYQHILTRALGLDDSFEHTLIDSRLAPGDVYLLCSDGLSKPLADSELAAVLAEQTDAAAVEALIEAANDAGGPDNISVILIRCVETDA